MSLVQEKQTLVAVVIPCFKVKNHILKVVEDIGVEVSIIYIVDDACPEETGKYVSENCSDNRLKIIKHEKNQGVGGSVITGYKAAIEDKVDIIVKIDGDGQMDPKLIGIFIKPIIEGQTDYSKGNRFYDLKEIHQMPIIRLLGNAVLSFLTKISSGYWDLFDPTNGYTAIHVNILKSLNLDKISKRYFFETDMLFHLNILRAVVIDIPMDAKYMGESSNLKITNILWEFIFKHIKNFSFRIFYNYYLRDMSIASFELIIGVMLILWGVIYGMLHWIHSLTLGIQTPAGTVMLSALPVIVGIQFILAFIGYDISHKPSRPFHLNKIYLNEK